MRRACAFVLVAAGLGMGCSEPKTPEEKLLIELGRAVAANDKQAALAMFDLDLRQRTELWEKVLRRQKNKEEQLASLQAAAPRLGDAAALVTVGDEAWREELFGRPWAEELGKGKCALARPSPDDGGRWVMPKEDARRMEADVGRFVFEMRTSVGWLPAFRVNCPQSGTSLWVQLAQRKRAGDGAEAPPVKIVRVEK